MPPTPVRGVVTPATRGTFYAFEIYKDGNDVKINDLDNPGVFVGSVLKENGN